MPVCQEPLCPRCGLPYPSGSPSHLCGPCSEGEYPFSKHRSYGLYQGTLEELIRRFKYGGQTFLKEALADLLFCAYMGLGEEVDLVVSVPLSRGRLKERGFDQSLLLAKGFARRSALKLGEGVLEKVKETPPQVGLSGKERRQNLRGAFAVKEPEAVKGKKVLVVDDVFTTGATLSEVSKVLLKAGAKEVFAITVARSI